ncbi:MULTISPECIES: hypothetical protein [Streptomyces]|uniref:Transposase n=1 Tax=Streptomyces ramulosus TaxID=47762 RepID=A0ABW1FU02_9ACTN
MHRSRVIATEDQPLARCPARRPTILTTTDAEVALLRLLRSANHPRG